MSSDNKRNIDSICIRKPSNKLINKKPYKNTEIVAKQSYYEQLEIIKFYNLALTLLASRLLTLEKEINCGGYKNFIDRQSIFNILIASPDIKNLYLIICSLFSLLGKNVKFSESMVQEQKKQNKLKKDNNGNSAMLNFMWYRAKKKKLI